MIKQNLFKMAIVSLLAATLFNNVQAAETRCGWLQNPTPGNWFLTDAEGSWTISTQGQNPNDAIELPVLNEKKGWFVKTGGSSGYACSCLSVTVDKPNKQILTASKAKQLPIKKCSTDKSLPKPE